MNSRAVSPEALWEMDAQVERQKRELERKLRVEELQAQLEANAISVRDLGALPAAPAEAPRVPRVPPQTFESSSPRRICM